jgi:hypothetical protein
MYVYYHQHHLTPMNVIIFHSSADNIAHTFATEHLTLDNAIVIVSLSNRVHAVLVEAVFSMLMVDGV